MKIFPPDSNNIQWLRLLVPLLLLLPVSLNAQYYSVGADPSSIKWNQSQVRQFNLIFPENQRRLATRYSRVLSDIAGYETASMKAQIRKTPVILHPFVSWSNGNSILAPRRIELFPKQPIALETNDFSTQLVIHEVRHFAQMDRLNTGVTKLAGYILGEQAQSLVLGIHVSKWLLEGDAVLTETLLSHGGRGRIAGFIQPLRSRLIDNKDLSWDRILFGSYQEVLPDEYLFGYFLTARGRMLADPMLWSDALGQLGKNPLTLKGLSGLTRPKTGFRFSKLYVETLDWLRKYWTNPLLTAKVPENLIALSRDTNLYMNYFRPQRFSNQEVICLKKSIADLPAFVIIDSLGQERIVIRPGSIEDAGFSYSNGQLVWTELIQDSRWENRSWSELFSYDFASGKTSRLSHKQRFFSPVLNSAGDQIAVIDEQADGSSFIRILDASNGRQLKSIEETDNNHFSYLCWGKNDEIVAVTTGAEGRKLLLIDFNMMTQVLIFDAGYADITCPAAIGDWVYFTGPFGTTQGLYRTCLRKPETESVFEHPHGINYLSTQGGDLYLSVYSSDGYRPAKVAIKLLKGNPINHIEPLIEPVTAIIQRAEGEFPIVYSNTDLSITATKYNKTTHLLKLHSWSPVFVNPDSYQISPGVVLMSQNDLSTLTCWAGYQYNKTDLSHNMLGSVRYTGLYPTLEMDFSKKYRIQLPSRDSTDEQNLKFIWPYSQYFRFGSGIPLNFSSGAWNRRVQPSFFFEHINALSIDDAAPDQSSWMAGFSLYSAIIRKLSYRDLFPEWGASVNLRLFKAFNTDDVGMNGSAKIMLYLPGVLPNSSLRIMNSVNILNSDLFYYTIQDYPRGLVINQSGSLYNLKLDFAFPVSYPDYHLSWLIYIKRIKADLFFDAATQLNKNEWKRSVGLDLTLDYFLMRSGIQLESGFRMMYFPETRNTGAEFLFSFSVN